MKEISQFHETLRALTRSLRAAEIRHAIIGGIAVIIRGYDRTTLDIDAVLWDVDDRLDEVISELELAGFFFRYPDASEMARKNRLLLMKNSSDFSIDLSLGLMPFELEVIDRAEDIELPDLIIRVATAEDLVIMKLIAGRPRDKEDVGRLVELWPEMDRARIKNYLTEFSDIMDDPTVIGRLDWLYRS